MVQDTLIPRIQHGDEIDISPARWILVVEKEARRLFILLNRLGISD